MILSRGDAATQQRAALINAEMRASRVILDADMLHSLISPRARLEVKVEGHGAFMFSIDGVLNGQKIVGAMFGGECILVFAPTEREAQELANAGLRKTVELLEEEYRTRQFRLSPTEEGLSPEAAGRRALADRPLTGRALEQRDVLKRIMTDALSKPKNWKP